MIRKSFSCFVLTLSLAILGTSAPCGADMVDYGDFSGDTVEFLMVTEISGDPLPLFGPPTVIGDSLDFIAPGFISESIAGGIDLLDGRLRFMVEANDGFLIDSIRLDEFGAFITNGDDSFALVSAIAFVQIGDDVFDSSFLFDTSGDSIGPWMAGLEIDFEPTDKITFVMDNTLLTIADDNGVAFIDKKGVRVGVSTIPAVIPEPTSALVVLVFLAGTVIRRQRATAV